MTEATTTSQINLTNSVVKMQTRSGIDKKTIYAQKPKKWNLSFRSGYGYVELCSAHDKISSNLPVLIRIRFFLERAEYFFFLKNDWNKACMT